VNLVQQAGQALYLVDHDPALRVETTQGAGERLGVGEQFLVEALVEQVESVGVGELRSDPGALADTTQAEEEEAALGQPIDARKLG